jgi:hypothetical protein
MAGKSSHPATFGWVILIYEDIIAENGRKGKRNIYSLFPMGR